MPGTCVASPLRAGAGAAGGRDRRRTPIAHAAWVERAFLGPALRAAGGVLPRPIIDTSLLWRLLGSSAATATPVSPAADITDALGLPTHHPHQALGDALTTAQVFLALATHLEAAGHGALRELAAAEAGSPPTHLQRRTR